MKIIGLTGGIATGKSTVTQILKDHNFDVIDADQIARELVVCGSSCFEQIKQTFGSQMILDDGNLDRLKLGNLIFSDKNQKKKLDQIMQPAIFEEIMSQIQEKKQANQKIVFLDMPLLIEMNYIDVVDEVWLVYTTPTVQLQRLIARDHLTKEQALNRIASQMPIEDKKKYADLIIDNNLDMLQLTKQVNEKIQQINY